MKDEAWPHMTQPTNGSSKLTALTVAVLISVVGMAVTWGNLSTTVTKHITYANKTFSENKDYVQCELAKKVDEKQYHECMKAMERDMKLVRAQINKMDEKVDRLLERVK